MQRFDRRGAQNSLTTVLSLSRAQGVQMRSLLGREEKRAGTRERHKVANLSLYSLYYWVPIYQVPSYPGQGSAVRPRVSQRQSFPYNLYLSLYICVSPPKKFDLEVATDRGEAYTHKPAQAKVGAVSAEPTSRPSRVTVVTHPSRAEGPYDKMPRDHLQRQSRSKPHAAAGSGPCSGPRASCKSMQR